MKLLTALCVGSLLASSLASANPYLGECSRGYRNDSYNRGVEAGFKGSDNLRPQLADEYCYQLGTRRGQNLRNEAQIFDCDGDFDRGYEKGFVASELSAGSACYNAGYGAGKALLDVGAREGNSSLVGSACVNAYQQGANDSASGQIAYLPTTEEPVATCYRLGFYDGK